MPGTFDEVPHFKHPDHDLKLAQAMSWERDAFEYLQHTDPTRLVEFCDILGGYPELQKINREEIYFRTRKVIEFADGSTVDNLAHQIEAILIMGAFRKSLAN